MGNVFISYRREDSAGWAGRLAERLKQTFGAESIFMDIDTIQPGTDFTQACVLPLEPVTFYSR